MSRGTCDAVYRAAVYRAGAYSVAVGAVLLLGCHTIPPTTNPESLPTLPAAWTAGSDANNGAASADDPWWRSLASDQLDTLIARALDHNHNLQAAAANVDAALAQAKLQGADRLPQASVGLDAARRQQVFVGLPVPGSDGLLKSTSTSFSANLAISWEADLWGRLRAGHRAANQDLAAAQADYAGARLSLAAQVAKAWLSMVEAERLVALGEATIESRRRTRERVAARFERGLAPSVDLRLARANEAAAQGELQARRRTLDGLRRQLEILLGVYPKADIGGPSDLPALPSPVAAGLPSELLRRRPDLAAAEARLAAAGWRVAEARAAFYPRLSLTGSSGSSSDSLSDLLDGDFSIWSLAGNLLQPIFQGGRLRAAAELATASHEFSLANYAQTLLRALGEVESRLSAEQTLSREVDAFATASQEAQRAAQLAEDRYRSGLGNYLAVLESQRQTFEAETRLLTLRGLRLRNRVDLHLALGGDARSLSERSSSDTSSSDTSLPTPSPPNSASSTPFR